MSVISGPGLAKVCAIAALGSARTAVATVIEGAVRAIGAVSKHSQRTETLASALRNWVRFDTLFFYPNFVVRSSAASDNLFCKLDAPSYGLDAGRELALWVLRHLQVPIKGTPIDGALLLAERIACTGLLISSAFECDRQMTTLETGQVPEEYTLDPSVYKKSLSFQIIMKICIGADAALRLVAKDYSWYKTADTSVRVTGAVCFLLYLWIDPKSPAYTAGNFASDSGGDDPDKGKKLE